MRKIYLPAALLLVLCQSCDSADATKLRAENHELKARLAALGQDTTSEADALARSIASTVPTSNDTAAAGATLTLASAAGSGAASTSTSTASIGMWQVGHYVDKFGETTSKGYITTSTPITGTFSNSATQDSELLVSLMLDADQKCNIQLYEYAGNNPVKAYSAEGYEVNVKDKDGKLLNLDATNYSDRLSFDKSASKKLHNAFLKGGKLQFVIRESNNSTTQYKFTLDNADGFLAARKELKGVK